MIPVVTSYEGPGESGQPGAIVVGLQVFIFEMFNTLLKVVS